MTARWAKGLALAVIAAAVGCSVLDKGVRGTANVAANAGVISRQDADSAGKVSKAFRKSAEDFTDSEEHYIGRSVAAQIFANYTALDKEALNAYVSRVGRAVAIASDRPETFGGYHFQVLDSDEINAFAAPGGFIFVTRGTLALCEDEDMLAGVLAHEVGHVVRKHGLKAISKARLSEAFGVLTGETAQVLTGHQAEQLSKALDGSVHDITDNLFKSGFGKSAEKDADQLGAAYAARAGYDPEGLVRVLLAMQKKEGVAQGGFFQTHPKAEYRLEVVREKIADDKLSPASPAADRADRFKAAVGA
jgi:predicted Zn-dependent protease